MDRDEDLEKYFYSVFNRMMSAFSSGAVGVKISIDPEGNVHIDPIKPRKRKIYVPYEVVDAGNEIVVTLDRRNIRKGKVSIRTDHILVETPKGERYIKLPSPVLPSPQSVEERNGILEIILKKGEGQGEQHIHLK